MRHALTEYTEAMRLKDKSRLNKTEKIAFENTDFALVLSNMMICVTRLMEDYESQLEMAETEFSGDAVAMIDYLKRTGCEDGI